ncbi:MAG: 4Fe-4S dicluster domain-containing protein [Candidatus Cloacimonadota bacterium]|nr:4Fe-4S dicluster domain-containing protein [Candidatus Cloacimonadota bacterium]
MSKILKTNNPIEQTLKDILKYLLDSKHVSAVFSLRKVNKKGSVDYGLISDVAKLNEIAPLHPIMPANAGQLLGRFTPMNKPVAAVVRPCEFRAFVELAKREQGQMDNFLFITYSCGGVFQLKDQAEDKIKNKLNGYWDSIKKGEIHESIRNSCKTCEHIVPLNSDIFISLVGEENGKIYLNTEKAEKMLKGFEIETKEAKFDEIILKNLLTQRSKYKEEIYSKIDTKDSGLDGLIDIFGKCIGCRGCNTVCPICYCTLCDFDSFNYDYNTPIMEKELAEKGALRLPPDTLFFHLGRLSHMSFSCVGCGMCSDVCPASIPVADVFKKTGEETAGMFDFVAGRRVDEEIPVMIYKEEEFPELGE